MEVPIFVIDAYAERPFTGNPAPVCYLEQWLPDTTMQSIAAEMNHSETVFFVPKGRNFAIRWFTPTCEVGLVGHATMAAGHLVLNRLRPGAQSVQFLGAKGDITVSRDNGGLCMDMPALVPSEISTPNGIGRALGQNPTAVLAAMHYLCVFDRADQVSSLSPDMRALSTLELPAVIVTAPGDSGADFVSRFFAPAAGVPEDPVSGVAHCSLVPYWSKRLGKTKLVGRQLSKRGGIIRCEDCGERVRQSGNAFIVLEGHIRL